MNERSEVSDSVRALLREKVVSYEQLEALLLLRRRRSEALSVQAVAEALGMTDDVTSDALGELCAEGLLGVRTESGTKRFRYTADPQLAASVDALAAAWESNCLAVMNLMSANAIERLRTGALRAFSEAFLLGRKKSDG